MKINNIAIQGIGGIKNLTLTFDEKANFICGPNGIGKTTVLESIIRCFSNDPKSLQKHVQAEYGNIDLKIDTNDNGLQVTLAYRDSSPEANNNAVTPLYHQIALSKRLIQLRTNRMFPYQQLNFVSRDPSREHSHQISDSISQGIQGTSIKSWFVNRWLYSAHKGVLTSTRLQNLEHSKACFSILNSDFSFFKVDAGTNNILIKAPSGEIPFEYLSSGFKSSLTLLLGIIAEIEFRFDNIAAQDFDGVIIIDEIELHLHPEWQARIVTALQTVFAKAQFIITTHSAHVIQAASPNQVIALEFQDDNIIQRDLSESAYGFQGWSVEEILRDIMGMESTQSTRYTDTIKAFTQAIDSGNVSTAEQSYAELMKMLHPSSHLRKLFSFQLIGVGGVAND